MSADTAPGPRAVSVPQLLAVAPLLAIFAGTLVVVGGWAFGGSPFWPVERVTLSEAVLTKDAAEVVRLIDREGVDPNRAWPVRAELVRAAPVLTPLEAAVMVRRSEMVALLLRHGAALPDGEARAALICLGVASAAEQIVEFLLATGDGSDPRGHCTSGRSSS